jgi:hypothetical protein
LAPASNRPVNKRDLSPQDGEFVKMVTRMDALFVLAFNLAGLQDILG